jgi:hypothetical protein
MSRRTTNRKEGRAAIPQARKRVQIAYPQGRRGIAEPNYTIVFASLAGHASIVEAQDGTTTSSRRLPFWLGVHGESAGAENVVDAGDK